jgi:hypothetical protein
VGDRQRNEPSERRGIEMNALQKATATDVATVEQQIEQHAQNIERIQNGAAFEIGRELKLAQELFKFKRDEGGFTGWLANRLPNINQRAAYRCIQRYEGIGEFDELVKLSNEAQLQAAGAEPDIKAIIADRVEAGEIFTAAQVKEIKEAAAKQADEFKATLKASEKAALEKVKAVKANAEKRIKELETAAAVDPLQPTFEEARDVAVKAKQDEIDALKAKIEAAENDPIMKAMRESVEDAARNGGKKASNKNPDYQKPTAEHDAMMAVVGTCRILLDRNKKTKPETIVAGFHDDEHRSAGIRDITKCRDFLNSILEVANA